MYVEKGFKIDRKFLTDEQAKLLEILLPTLNGKQAEIMQSIFDTFKLRRKD